MVIPQQRTDFTDLPQRNKHFFFLLNVKQYLLKGEINSSSFHELSCPVIGWRTHWLITVDERALCLIKKLCCSINIQCTENNECCSVLWLRPYRRWWCFVFVWMSATLSSLFCFFIAQHISRSQHGVWQQMKHKLLMENKRNWIRKESGIVEKNKRMLH